MKKIISVIFILFSLGFVSAQEAQQKPLSQTEYVKMLYDLQKIRAEKMSLSIPCESAASVLIWHGLRGLTTSKSRNDAELKRTLEEAAHRRRNPEKSQLPTEKEAAEVLSKSRQATLAAVEDMPDFVVKQQVARSAAYAGTNNFQNLDRLVVAVSYRASGQEEYKILSRNGILENNPKP